MARTYSAKTILTNLHHDVGIMLENNTCSKNIFTYINKKVEEIKAKDKGESTRIRWD